MLEILTTNNLIFLAVSFFAAIIATLAGFGSSTLLIPVAMFFMDIKTAVFIVACFHFFSNIFKVKLFWNKISLPIFLSFGVPSIIFAFLGAKFIETAPVAFLGKLVALFLISFSAFSFRQEKIHLTQNLPNCIIGGSASGFLAGLIGLGGVLRSIFLVSFALPKEIYIGTAAIIAFVVDVTRIPTYVLANIVQDTSYYWLLPFLVITAYLGVRVGKMFLNSISQEAFRKVVLVCLLLVGLKFLFS
jgi:hypothetical protein